MLKLPGWRQCEPLLLSNGRNDSMANGTIRIRRAGNTITVAREGGQELTANVSDFKNFTRFEVRHLQGAELYDRFYQFPDRQPWR